MKRLYGANSLQREAVYAAERFAAGAEKSARYAMFAALVAPWRRWSLPSFLAASNRLRQFMSVRMPAVNLRLLVCKVWAPESLGT